MGKIWMPGGGSGGASSDDCTATKDKVLSGYTAVTKDSDDEPVAGTMANRNNVDNNGSARLLVEDGKVKMFPHQGYYGGYYDGSPYYVWDTQTLVAERGGLTAAKLLAGQSALGVIGTATNDAVLDPQYLLTGYSGYDDGVKKSGTMANQGAKTSALNCGGSYTIPKGYHNGSGKVTANSLSSQTGATATAAQILSGQTAWVNGSKLTGSMANQGTKTSALNCGSSYTIPAGYHNGSGKVTANSLSGQTSANSGAGDIRSGKTAWVNGSKITGTLSIQSAISFSAAVLSGSSVRISWKNPAKGPWQGVFIQMSTSGYPGTGGGSRVYTGAGTNPNQAGGNNYVDIGGLNQNTIYYFTCTSYNDQLGWGSSHNVNAMTPYVGLVLYDYGHNPYGLYPNHEYAFVDSNNFGVREGRKLTSNGRYFIAVVANSAPNITNIDGYSSIKLTLNTFGTIFYTQPFLKFIHGGPGSQSLFSLGQRFWSSTSPSELTIPLTDPLKLSFRNRVSKNGVPTSLEVQLYDGATYQSEELHAVTYKRIEIYKLVFY